MGRIKQGINGPVQGKVGSVVGSSWKGIPYLKGNHKSRTKNISEKELLNRNKFAAAHKWLHPLLDFVRIGFKGYSFQAEGYNAAKSWLLKNALSVEGSDIRIDPALVKVSSGNLPLSKEITVSQIKAGELKFTWDTRDIDGGNRADQIMVLAYDLKNCIVIGTTNGQFRNIGNHILEVDARNGINYHLWVAFIAADRSRQSDSLYLGEWKTNSPQ